MSPERPNDIAEIVRPILEEADTGVPLRDKEIVRVRRVDVAEAKSGYVVESGRHGGPSGGELQSFAGDAVRIDDRPVPRLDSLVTVSATFEHCLSAVGLCEGVPKPSSWQGRDRVRMCTTWPRELQARIVVTTPSCVLACVKPRHGALSGREVKYVNVDAD